ncbi:TetR/AcrR family transcriptional regulator [Pontibacillus marinus]|uniref:TetR family transcriptional regulator n=1 Tax=Pontibacillus marinus BH030004 = DSM 16465 TaxID=1385511 RepID=A0A0A5G8U6_9BACI|nr:TetR/AcrR family transcriptional regulator [Pontibacillus marinus]KGX89561.1 TetR family transcriptional regulator [Pontibacillus marinus BH030004 = DSM 16465]
MAIQKSQEKRERILQAAIQTFSENGYSNATIKQIAKEAGVSFGTVFTYFENKNDLFQAAVLEPLEEVKAVMLDVPEPSEQPIEQIKMLIKKHFQYFAEQTTYMRMIQYVIGQPERFQKQFLPLDQFTIELRDALRPLIVKAQEKGEIINLEPNDVSDTYLAFINGVSLTFTDTVKNSGRWDTFTQHAFLLFGPKQ